MAIAPSIYQQIRQVRGTSWSYQPDYRLYAVLDSRHTTYSLTTLMSADSSVSTTGGVNQARFLLADPGQYILEELGTRQQKTDRGLHPMMAINMRTNNRYNNWGHIFSGYIDSVHHLFDAENGDQVQIMCSGPEKKWEKTLTTSDQAQQLAMAYTQNVAASSVLVLSAKAVGFPVSKLIIDPGADSGSGINPEGPQSAAINAVQQSWSAIMAQLQSNSGINWWFDERGRCHWERATFFQAQLLYRYITEADIIQADIFETDDGVITDVEVRYNVGMYTQMVDAVAPDPRFLTKDQMTGIGNMRKHLGSRRVVIYAPWIINNQEAAQYLANVLFAQFATNMLQAVITIPCDPLITAGSIIDVPSLRTRGGFTRYYVQGFEDSLTWTGEWVRTLMLAYGRSPNSLFPYVGKMVYPAPTASMTDATSPSATPLAFDASNPNKVTLPFVVMADPALKQNKNGTWPVRCDPSAFAPGSIIQLRDAKGLSVGPSGNGEYTAVAGSGGQTLYIASTQDNYANVVVIHFSAQPQVPALPDTSAYGASGGSTDPNTGLPTQSTTLVTQQDVQNAGVTPNAFSVFPIQGVGGMAAISQSFGYTNFEHPHTGIDIAVPKGTPIHAPCDGIITGVAWDVAGRGWQSSGFGYGCILSVGHYDIIFAHQVPPGDPLYHPTAIAGQYVKAGQVIGLVDSTYTHGGFSTGHHVHIGIWDLTGSDYAGTGNWIDPAPFLVQAKG